MKKITLKLLTISFLTLTSSQTSANTSLSLTLDGTIEKQCDVTQNGSSSFQDLDLTSSSEINGPNISLDCNYESTAAVTFSSDNNGYLAHDSEPTYNIPYTISLTGGLLTNATLDTPKVANNFPTISGTQTRQLKVKLSPPELVPAGTYNDVITVSVTTN